MARQLLDSSTGRRVRSSLEQALGSRVGRMLGMSGLASKPSSSETLLSLAGALLSLRGRASGPALATAFFDCYEASAMAERHAFLGQLHSQYQQDPQAIDRAIARWQDKRDEASATALSQASQSPCERLINMLNLAPNGTRRLISMRADLLSAPEITPGLKALDREFFEAFSTWFNAGFLEMRSIDWNAPAAVLERIIRYEAVHSIEGWDDLRRRVEPADRRCYAFFHPQMADDPLIFVEVALTDTIPSAIHQVIARDRTIIDPKTANCAIFYSISNCQQGLRGIPFGNFLIKQVVGLLKQELPQLHRFATLSPVPAFARWLAAQGESGVPQGDALRAAAARFLVTTRDKRGQVADPVGKFHLGNGARLEAIHIAADLSDKGQRESHGVMVNYLYDLGEIESNHVSLFELDTVVHSRAVEELLNPSSRPRILRPRRKLAAAAA